MGIRAWIETECEAKNSVRKTEPTKSTATSDYYSIIQCALTWIEEKKNRHDCEEQGQEQEQQRACVSIE